MTDTKPYDLVTIGDIFVDLVLSGFPAWPKPGEELYAQAMAREVGGGCAITAALVAGLGARSTILAAVGDQDQAWVAERLAAHRVDAGHLAVVPNEATALSVAVSTAADRAFFSYAGANRSLPKLLREPGTREFLCQARHVHLAFPVDPELLEELCATVHCAGGCVSLDVGWHPSWLADSASLAALRHVDMFFPNELEAERMTGQSQPEAMLAAFAQAQVPGVALKLGARGARLRWRGHDLAVEPIAVTPRDTTGAGDAFDAGFIHAWLAHQKPMGCLQVANICGALSTRQLGGLAGLPTADELLRELTQTAGRTSGDCN